MSSFRHLLNSTKPYHGLLLLRLPYNHKKLTESLKIRAPPKNLSNTGIQNEATSLPLENTNN